MTLEEQLLYVETHFPDAWEYLHDVRTVDKLPQFDDNDELITETEEESYGKRY